MPGKQRANYPAVAILKRVNLGKAVVKPGPRQQRMVAVSILYVFTVPRKQVVNLAVNVFGRAILVDCSVGPGWVVGHFS